MRHCMNQQGFRPLKFGMMFSNDVQAAFEQPQHIYTPPGVASVSSHCLPSEPARFSCVQQGLQANLLASFLVVALRG